MEQFAVDYEPNHLCQTCRYLRKCPRYKQLIEKLNEIEVKAFENWKLDVSVFFRVEDCDLYKVNWELMDTVQIEIVYGDSDDDEDYNDYEEGDDEDERGS